MINFPDHVTLLPGFSSFLLTKLADLFDFGILVMIFSKALYSSLAFLSVFFMKNKQESKTFCYFEGEYIYIFLIAIYVVSVSVVSLLGSPFLCLLICGGEHPETILVAFAMLTSA